MSVSNNELREFLTRALNALPAHADELRDLDAALGDGDLGITVRAGSAAVVNALAALPDGASLSDVLLAAGKAFSTANPNAVKAVLPASFSCRAISVHSKPKPEGSFSEAIFSIAARA